jgi:glycosyltransferase involved in cell wall biosynthesis
MLEGQPISILEAYAAGCAVIATGQPGIRDVFEGGTNGFEVDGTPADIGLALARAAGGTAALLEIALTNRRTADASHRTAHFVAALRRVLEGVPTP